MTLKQTLIGIVAVILVGSLGFYLGSLGGDVSTPSLGGVTHLSGLSVGSDGFTSTGATTLSSTVTTGGVVTLNAGQLRSYTNATTSVGSGTLKLSDVNGYDVVLLTPKGAAATKTLTFFASSTAATWLPTAGDMQETCFVNGTTTAATTITFAAGTGIDLESATSTLILPANDTACFKFIRQSATASTSDISALMIRYVDAD